MAHVPTRSWVLLAIGLIVLPVSAACQDNRNSSPEGAETSLEIVIARTIEAYGGEQSLLGATGTLQEGTVTSTMRSGAEGKIVRLYERPVRLRVEVEYSGDESEVRILDGGRGWRNGSPATGPMYEAMLLQAARLGLPVILLEFQASLQDRGEVERDGRRYRVIELGFHDGLTITMDIDPESGLILRSEGAISAGGGRPELTFATEYSDFRTVEGIVVPFHEVNYAQGRPTGETRLDSVDFLQEIPGGSFHPPIGPGATPDGQRSRT